MRTLVVLVIFLSMDCTVYGDCPEPTPGSNMLLASSHTFPVPEGTTATFACETGYKKRGNGDVVCSGGKWTPIKMACEVITCGSTEDRSNGHIDFSDGLEFGAFAYLICNDGYRLTGNDKIYCGGNSDWEGRLGECEAITCLRPNPITNGYFTPAKDTYLSSEVITYKCNGEYVLNGSRSSTCENEKFNTAPPTCVLVDCPNPKIDYGVAAGGGRPPYKYGTSVTFRCNVGYNLNGDPTVSCDINSKWSPPFPKCIPIECKVQQITNGEVVGGSRPTYTYSETITVKCSEGFYLNGQGTLKCGDRNQWSSAFPECTPIECKAPEIANGEVVDGSRVNYKYSDTITAKCSEGYKLEGETTVTCKEKDRWLPALPKCVLILCPTPQVEGGELVGGARPSYKYSDTVKFECKPGHNLSGKDTLTCEANSQWSHKLPQCTLVVCKTPEVKDGQVVKGSKSSYKYLDIVVFECKTGHTMSGQSTLKCDQNSQWSSELPQCTPNSVSKLKVLIIVLIVIGVIALIIFIVWFVWRRKKNGWLVYEASKLIVFSVSVVSVTVQLLLHNLW